VSHVQWPLMELT